MYDPQTQAAAIPFCPKKETPGFYPSKESRQSPRLLGTCAQQAVIGNQSYVSQTVRKKEFPVIDPEEDQK